MKSNKQKMKENPRFIVKFQMKLDELEKLDDAWKTHSIFVSRSQYIRAAINHYTRLDAAEMPRNQNPVHQTVWMSEKPLSEFDITKSMLEGVTDKKGKTRYVYSLANTCAAARECLQPITHNKTLYFYNSRSGLYEENKCRIESWLQTQFGYLVQNGDLHPSTTLKHRIEEIMKQLKNTNPCPEGVYPWNQYNGIPVANGVLVWDGERFNLIEYSREMMFTRKIPINYNPTADTTKIKQILYDWLEDDYPYLLQIPAQALLQSLPGRKPVKKAYMLVGEANTAKSTYLELLSDLFGKGCCARRCLQDLNTDFVASEMVGKYINLGDHSDEVSIEVFSALRRLTNSRTHRVKEKYKTPYLADITAVHVYTANKPPQLPESIDTDYAWWDICSYLRFRNTFPIRAQWYQDNVTPNLEGFLLLVLDELMEILKNGGELQHDLKIHGKKKSEVKKNVGKTERRKVLIGSCARAIARGARGWFYRRRGGMAEDRSHAYHASPRQDNH